MFVYSLLSFLCDNSFCVFRCLKNIHIKMLVCYPSCKKCKNLLISSIDSIIKHNPNTTIAIFNNNEYSKEDLREIRKHCQKLLVFDISLWMDIFTDCQTLHSQHNCYIRFLMPRVFQRFDKRIFQFIYCDEDCYCIGSIEKFWRYPFESDIVGIIDRAYGISIKDVEWFTKIHHFEEILSGTPKPYINAGLLKFKTSFDITSMIIPIYRLIICNVMNIFLFCDQTLIHMIDHDTINIELSKANDINISTIIVIEQSFKMFNIAHTYEYKNNIEKILSNIIKYL